MSVSVAIICRNSSDVIERCLESVKDADEIVVVDTGSDDNTMEIVRKYTDKVYEYWGCNEGGKKDGLFANFADARNKALEYCTQTHILTIDSDEVLNYGMDEMKRFTGVSMSVKCISADTGESHYQPRLYLRSPSIFWQGAAHNYLNCPDGEPSNITITFHGNKQKQRDPDRTMRILERWIKDNPDNCLREMYYLSKEYYKRRWYNRAIAVINTYLLQSKNPGEKADALIILALCHIHLKNKPEAINACLGAININPDFEEALRMAGELATSPARLKWKHLASQAANVGVLFIRQERRIRVTLFADKDYTQFINSVRNGKIDIEIICPQNYNQLSIEAIKSRLANSDIIHTTGRIKAEAPNKRIIRSEDFNPDAEYWTKIYLNNKNEIK